MQTSLDNSVDRLLFGPPGLGTVLYLPGLPGGGASSHDRSPYGNTGTVVGAAWRRLPSGLWCLDFDGADDRITLPNVAAISQIAQGDFTIKLWWIADTSESADFFYQYNAANLRFSIRWGKAEGFYYNCWDAAGLNNVSIYKAWLPTNGIPYHLVFRRSGNSHDILVNGTSLGATTDADKPDAGVNTSYFGSLVSTTLKGKAGLFAIMSSAWTDAEVANSYAQERHLFGVW
ncbi:MAG: hypothetical protein HY530_00905 [Chloroflexi bacterium]|nr:hypothetical protein [Chloroflexota bacterium]